MKLKIKQKIHPNFVEIFSSKENAIKDHYIKPFVIWYDLLDPEIVGLLVQKVKKKKQKRKKNKAWKFLFISVSKFDLELNQTIYMFFALIKV